MFLQSILLMHIQHCSAFSYTLQTNLDLSFELSNLKHLHCGKWCILTYSVRNAALPSWCPWSCLSAVCCYRVCWLLCVSLSVTCVTQNDFVILPRQWLCVWCVFSSGSNQWRCLLHDDFTVSQTWRRPTLANRVCFTSQRLIFEMSVLPHCKPTSSSSSPDWI